MDALLPNEAAKLRETPFAVIQVRMNLEQKQFFITCLICSLIGAAFTATTTVPEEAYCVVSVDAVYYANLRF